MGREIIVPVTGHCALAPMFSQLAGAGMAITIQMIDGALVPPNTPPPAVWREIRLRTPAGTVTIRRTPDAIAVTVFGNADAALEAAQRAIADALVKGLGHSTP